MSETLKKSRKGKNMLEYRYDTQLLIDGKDLDEDAISDYFNENFNGDCLLAVGDEEMISSLNKSIQKHNNLMGCQPYTKHRFR